MSEWNGFGDLDLSDVREQGPSRLTPGKYITNCTAASVESGNGNDKKVQVTLQSEDGDGEIKVTFNTKHSNLKAEEIGKSQLKSFLINGGHPNPDRPRDIVSLRGLRVGVVVGMGKPFVSKTTGEKITLSEVKNYTRPDMLEGKTGPSEATPTGQVNGSSAAPSTSSLDDDLPF